MSENSAALFCSDIASQNAKIPFIRDLIIRGSNAVAFCARFVPGCIARSWFTQRNVGGISSGLLSQTACHAGGRGFKSRPPRHGFKSLRCYSRRLFFCCA